MERTLLPRLGFLAILLVALFPFFANAGQLTYHNKQYGADLVPFSQSSSKLEVQDDYYLDMLYNPQWSNNYEVGTVNNRIRLKYTGAEQVYYSQSWSLDVVVNITWWDGVSLTPNVITAETLSIDYSPTGAYVDEAVYPFSGAHKLSVEVVSVTPCGGCPISVPLTDDFQLEAEIEVERYQKLDIYNVPEIAHSYEATTNRLTLYWDALEGAEEYDVEWYFSSAYAATPVAQHSDIADRDYSRVTVSGTRYELSVPFHGGKLWYRVRGVGYHGTGFAQRYGGAWSNHGDDVIPLTNPDPHRNWTYGIVYAEEGKSKETMGFVDGTGKSRQQVTYLNSEGAVLVGETYYDYEGRPVIGTLPAPDKDRSRRLGYYEDFTQIGTLTTGTATKTELHRDDYDRDEGTCGPVGITLSTAQGASNYYSNQNPLKSYGFNALIPDAQGYAFTRTQYGKEGQVVAAGGVGAEHHLKSQHATKSHIATPLPEKLDRLFGSEAGHPSHYRMVVNEDPNGQLAVAYTNLGGQTVATSLIGEVSNLETLNKYSGVSSVASSSLESFNLFNEDEEAWIVDHHLFVEATGSPYTFHYSLDPETFNSICTTSHNCTYDLVITIHDDCGRKIYDNTTTAYTDPGLSNRELHKVHVIDQANYQTAPGTITVNFPEVGTYRVRKKLTLNQAAVQAELNAFRASLSSCIDETAILSQYTNQVNTDDCAPCTGSDCDPQNQVQTPCEALLEVLSADMSPDGQYFDNVPAGSTTAPSETWLTTHLWADGPSTNWTNAGFSANGQTLTSWAEVRTHWQPAWATQTFTGTVTTLSGLSGTSLTELHPEYCHYTWCMDLEDSYTFDVKVAATTTYADAIGAWLVSTPACSTAVVGVPHLLDVDDYFNNPIGSGDKTAMLNYLTDYDGSGTCLWDFAGAQSSCTNCDEHWNTFKGLYLGKKGELIRANKNASTPACQDYCDNSLPPDGVADANSTANANGYACSGNPAYVVGFVLRQPDASELLASLVSVGTTSTNVTTTNTNTTNYQNSLSPLAIDDKFPCGPEYVANGDLTSTNYWEASNGQPNAFATAGVAELESVENAWANLSNIMSNSLTAGQTYVFSYDVSALKKPCTNVNGPCWTDNEIDEYYVTLANTATFSASTVTDPNNQELLHGSGYGLSLIHSGNATTLRIVFTADDNYTHLHLSHRGSHSTHQCYQASTDCAAEWIGYDNVSIRETCTLDGLDHCVCTLLDQDSIIYMQNGGTLANLNSHLATNWSAAYGIVITANDIATWRDSCNLSTGLNPGNTVPTEVLEGCNGFGPDPVCGEDENNLANFYGQLAIERERTQKSQEFLQDYKAWCLGRTAGSDIQESFTVDYQDAEHHFLLFYYDQAGNLVQTVPPEGVVPLTSSQQADVANHRRDPVAYPTPTYSSHGLKTQYEYNSFNEVVREIVPDRDKVAGGGYTARYWYDDLGRIKASQSARQYPTNQYIYNRYDGQGRLVEDGQVTYSTAPTIAQLNHPNWPWNWVGTGAIATEVTTTTYDRPMNATTDGYFGAAGQQNLRSRVASIVTADATNTAYHSASHYSYDLHGNVDVYLQEVPELLIVERNVIRTEYDYDLVSGNVNEVRYQPNEPDQLIHSYCYDADNRITAVHTSRDGQIWDTDAEYFYYLHGPLARQEIGEQKVQGLDYAYTIHGWLKGVNANQLDATKDMGRDGQNSTTNPWWSGNPDLHDEIARDAFGFTLGYYTGDYQAAGTTDFTTDLNLLPGGFTDDLYNGNIRHMATALTNEMGITQPVQATRYRYDQLNRLLEMTAHQPVNPVTTNNYAGASNSSFYHTTISYDANGNILSLERDGDNPAHVAMDNISYTYNTNSGMLTNNQLVAVADPTPVSNFGNDLDGGSAYTYDADGNLITDFGEEIDQIEWNLQGKVSKVTRIATSTKPDLEFRYDPMGNRRMKIVKPRTGSGLQNEQHWQITHYTRDASGNMLATYTQKHESNHGTGKWYMKLDLDEHNLFGSRRLGTQYQNQMLISKEISISSYDSEGYLSYQTVHGAATTEATEAEMGFYQRPVTAKAYELSNHLGNVLQTISDRKIAEPSGSILDYYTADVLSYSDYYPFGMVMENRNGSNREDRFGFQDQETDEEIWGGSSFFKYRMNDPRIGRFFAVDPLAPKYPFNSNYAFSENRLIDGVEIEGLEHGPDLFSATYSVAWNVARDRGEDIDGPIMNVHYNCMMAGSLSGALIIGGAYAISTYGLSSTLIYLGEELFEELVGHVVIPDPGDGLQALFRSSSKSRKVSGVGSSTDVPDPSEEYKYFDSKREYELSTAEAKRMEKEINPGRLRYNCMGCAAEAHKRALGEYYQQAPYIARPGILPDRIDDFLRERFTSVEYRPSNSWTLWQDLDNFIPEERNAAILLLYKKGPLEALPDNRHAMNAIKENGKWMFRDAQDGTAHSLNSIRTNYGAIHIVDAYGETPQRLKLSNGN